MGTPTPDPPGESCVHLPTINLLSTKSRHTATELHPFQRYHPHHGLTILSLRPQLTGWCDLDDRMFNANIVFNLCSGLSWSGSSNTQESSPVTPEIPYSLGITLPDETPITSFLSQFYDPDVDLNSDSGSDRLARLSRGKLDFFGDRDGKMMRNKKLPELPVSYVADNANPSLPHQVNLPKNPISMPSTATGCAPSPVDVRKSRRFCRDFGGPSLLRLDHIHDEFPADLGKDLPVTHSSPSLTFPLKHDILLPPSRSEVRKHFSEEETATVREFLRMWGSNNKVKVSRSKPALDEDEAPGGNDDHSWEAADSEDGVEGSTPCDMLLHEVSKMVGLPLEQSTMEDQSSIASTPPGLDALGRLSQDDQEQTLCFPSSYQSAAPIRSSKIPPGGDGADVGDGVWSGVGQRVDQPLDVAPRASLTCDLLARHNTPVRKGHDESVTSKSMDVPIVLATSLDAARSHDLLLQRQLSPGRAKSDSDMRRRGRIFLNAEEAKIPSTSSAVSINVDRSFVPTRKPPLPPPPLPALPPKRVSALDRLDFSLSRLKTHGSHQRKPSSTEKANVCGHVSLEARRPPLSAASMIRERKHQSGATARVPYPRSAHGRHFSSPMLDGTPERPKAPRTETDPTNAHLQERAAKLFPCPENREVSMRSFMEMDVAPPITQPPRRTSRLGRVAARLSQGIANFGKNLTGYKGIKECA